MSKFVDHAVPDGPPSKPPFVGTRLESVEEIRRATRVERLPQQDEPAAADDTQVFRPALRPPTALLCVLFDGREDGEWRRICQPSFIIGRVEGDLVIPHDNMISTRHAEISHRRDGEKYRWYLSDLQSTNGTYVRVGRSVLNSGQEILIGRRRYRFSEGRERPGNPSAEEAKPADRPRGTTEWRTVAAADLSPNLVELTNEGEGARLSLAKPDVWLGRDSKQCDYVIDDLLVSPRHARVYRDEQSRWVIANNGSRNGVWLRVNRVPLAASGQFQVGEQRFIIRIS